MAKNHYHKVSLPVRSSLLLFRGCATALLVLILFLFPACVKKKMSLKEAKQVTVSMSEKSFVPPPRRIDDILAILDQPGQFDPEITAKIKAKADASPPDTDNPATLAQFYGERGKNARELGRFKQYIEDLRIALRHAEDEAGQKRLALGNKDYAIILMNLGIAEAFFGNFTLGVTLCKRSLKVRPWSSRFFLTARMHFKMGDFKTGEKITHKGIAFCNERLSNPRFPQERKAWLFIDLNRLKANSLESKGRFAEAEPYRHSIVKKMQESTIEEYPFPYIVQRTRLAQNLARQDRLLEAELEIRDTLKQSIAHGGKDSSLTGGIIEHLGHILLLQGRLEDAEKLIRTGIGIFEASGLSDDSSIMGRNRVFLGKVSVAKLDFVQAMKQFDHAKFSLQDNRYFYENTFARSPDIILSLLKTGRTEEAVGHISAGYEKYAEYLGHKHYRTAQMLGLRGMANAITGKEAQAVEDFSESLPILLKQRVDSSDYLKNVRLRIIVETYLELLTRIHKSKQDKEYGINASEESFKLVEAMIGSSVQGALGASGARAAAVTPELADLVRKEQDTLKQVSALQATLSNAVAAPSDQQDPNAVKDLKATITTLNQARAALLDEIQRRFPKYADFTDPKPADFSVIQKHLKPREALIVIYPAQTSTYVWSIPHTGKILFNVVPLGKKDLQITVSHLRRALNPGPGTFGDIPDFDLTRAYNLYSTLLKPVEDGWKNAKDLIIVATGPLGPLPFSVLPTAPVDLGPERNELFARYRKLPWLIRKVSITRQPSVSSFVTLRDLPEGDPARKALVGFGDPIYNPTQLTRLEIKKGEQATNLASRGGQLNVRGIRISEKGDLDSEQISSIQLGHLNRLPDTAEEIKSIARAMGADPDRDIFLGKRASEQAVKTMDLSDRKVVAFASHALVPGDLDGLDQPALALSAPSVTGGAEDGLLTMGEVLKLKLNADWVVLSACNTGAADGAGAESVSGLGRAFFYAGTRAMLVSMWPVETTSARKLTTEIFRYQTEDKTLSRARAHQKSMLKLIDDPGLKNNSTGKIVASYAHPFFWAPFIIVGEGGGTLK
ncbi:CHAT domain-containing protein [Thermodesulfobacteriota bacterium]